MEWNLNGPAIRSHPSRFKPDFRNEFVQLYCLWPESSILGYTQRYQLTQLILKIRCEFTPKPNLF